MKSMPQIVLDAATASSRRETLLLTLYLDATLRFSKSKTNIVFPESVGDTYTAKLFGISELSQSIEGQIERVSIVFDNSNGDMSGYSETYDFQGAIVEVIRIFRDAFGDSTYYEPVFYGTMEAPKFAVGQMEVSATSGLALYRRSPARIYSHKCPFIFGDADCQRAKTGTVTCAQTPSTNRFYDMSREGEALVSGVVSSPEDGSKTKKAFFDTDRAFEPDDCWAGKRLIWASGSNIGENDLVDTFAGSTSVMGRFAFGTGFTYDILQADRYYIGDVWEGVMLQWTSGSNEGESAEVTEFLPVGEETALEVTSTVGGDPKLKFIDSGLIGHGDDIYIGYRLRWLTGTNTGQEDFIADFTSADGTVEMTNESVHDIGVGDTYTITTGPRIVTDSGATFNNLIAVGVEYILSNSDISRAPLYQTGTASHTTDASTLKDTSRTEGKNTWKHGTLEVVHSGTTESRLVISFDADTNTLIVDFPFSFIVTAGNTYTLTAGCDQTWEACLHSTAAFEFDLLQNGDFESGNLRAWGPHMGWSDMTWPQYWHTGPLPVWRYFEILDWDEGPHKGLKSGQFEGLDVYDLIRGAVDSIDESIADNWESSAYPNRLILLNNDENSNLMLDPNGKLRDWAREAGVRLADVGSGPYWVYFGGEVDDVSDNIVTTYSVGGAYKQNGTYGLRIITTEPSTVRLSQIIPRSLYADATANGTTTTLIDVNRWMPDDYWIGATLIRRKGKVYESRTVTDYVLATGTLTVDSAFSSVTSTGDHYQLIHMFRGQETIEFGGAIYIPEASSLTHLKIQVMAAYERDPDLAWKLIGELTYDLTIEDAWQSKVVESLLTHSGRTIQFLAFVIEASRLDGGVYLDDLYCKTDVRPWGPRINNTRNFGGFPAIARLGDSDPILSPWSGI